MLNETPRARRLRNDLIALERLRDESTVFDFTFKLAGGQSPQEYILEFHGASLERERSQVVLRQHHQVECKLGAGYPRSMPELRWLSPIYHPNISEIGMICLGGYGTHWVPSLHLDELCVMLWDMARYYNYDVRSPYNREAALWSAHQVTYKFPLDSRALRDKRVAQGRIEGPETSIILVEENNPVAAPEPPKPPPPPPEIVFLD